MPGAVFASHRALDTFIHGRDIARATGQGDTLDPGLVLMVYEIVKPHEEQLRAGGAFGQRGDVAEDADIQTNLLAMLGRDARKLAV
ncbi:MAG: hypothetical protein M3069_31195 [Chloroflexota bacterium]|nr:hypothetical protein [Chloroflexota bacterium]